jgi:hypothetical protein
VAIVWCARLQVFDQARVVTEFEEDFEVAVVVGGEMTSKEEVCWIVEQTRIIYVVD